MLVGREAKLETLQKYYRQGRFQILVVYGLHRTGKTALLSAFCKDKPTIWFSAQKAAERWNLAAFSEEIRRFPGTPPETPAFTSWGAALDFVGSLAAKEQLVLVMENFPHAAADSVKLLEAMARRADTSWRGGKLFLILSGSQTFFMESEVIGEQSPLFGRRLLPMKLEALDHREAAGFLEGRPAAEKLRLYACVGGLPGALCYIDREASFLQNLRRLFFEPEGPLFRQTPRILWEELREPAVYNTILAAMAGGARRLHELVAATGEESQKVNKYLQTLQRMQVVAREVPFGEEGRTSRKGTYKMSDNSLCFWYRFVFPCIAQIERGGGGAICEDSVFLEELERYIAGKPFEEICFQYLFRQNRAGELPFLGNLTGKWWEKGGAETCELVAANPRTRQILYGECRWKNNWPEWDELQKHLARKDGRFLEYWERFHCLFSREAFPRELRNRQDRRLKLISAEDFFNV